MGLGRGKDAEVGIQKAVLSGLGSRLRAYRPASGYFIRREK
jgi:hypothetical protein